jgi:UDP-N-acetylmuramate--alanine ligase
LSLLSELFEQPDRPVYLSGIGGIGVSAIARILHREGVKVLGSDRRPSPVTAELMRLGIPVIFGQSAGNVPPDTQLVIASAAVPAQNPELVQARALSITCLKYAEALGRLIEGRTSIAVAGTHGKTTTTAMTTHILMESGLDPTMVVGGSIPMLGGTSRVGRSDLIVLEACEFDRSFLNLRPSVAIVTNIEADHLDYYSGIDEIRGAFADFGACVQEDGAIIACAEDPTVPAALADCGRLVVTYGIDQPADIQARDLRCEGGLPVFTLVENGVEMGEVRLAVPGRHNVLNALAAYGAARAVDASFAGAQQSFETFPGVNRRFHLVHEQGGVSVVDDYAHHPTEVRATLAAARERYPDHDLLCVFQPHQYSRTRYLLEDFADALTAADRVYLPEIYRSRDSEADRQSVSSRDLATALERRGVETTYEPEFDRMAALVAREAGASAASLVLTMGAGNVYRIGEQVRDLLLVREELERQRRAHERGFDASRATRPRTRGEGSARSRGPRQGEGTR